MEIKPTPIDGLIEVIPNTFRDERGWFLEIYKNEAFWKLNSNLTYVQENLSYSKKGVLRGLHLQLPPFQQAKIVMVLQGRVLDVVVDLRKGSGTFGQSFQCMLNATSHNMLIIPEGFAHGFSAMEDSIFFYKCSSVYSPDHETGIRWDDRQLKIDWQVNQPILSEKDQHLPTLEELLIKSVISPR